MSRQKHLLSYIKDINGLFNERLKHEIHKKFADQSSKCDVFVLTVPKISLVISLQTCLLYLVKNNSNKDKIAH